MLDVGYIRSENTYLVAFQIRLIDRNSRVRALFDLHVSLQFQNELPISRVYRIIASLIFDDFALNEQLK